MSDNSKSNLCSRCGFDKEGINFNSLDIIMKHSRECMVDEQPKGNRCVTCGKIDTLCNHNRCNKCSGFTCPKYSEVEC